ncbi:MAG: DNA repair exonuclease [Lautropia sp.]|nr:DNA repair exonuclease [Lautropia sp.]
MRFIHTADLHIDSPMRGLAAYPDAPAGRLRSATREAFQNLVGIAIEEKVDFMVIAGDIYDGDWKDFNTGLFFIAQMGRLKRAGIPVYLLYGNHDAEADMTRSLTLPDNVHVFSSRKAETFRHPHLNVALHGRSFRVAATTDNLVPNYPEPVSGCFNIGVLHTALEGRSEHARYAPCTVAELEAKGYQYWALGHVHEQAIMPAPEARRPGQPLIAFSGNIQGRHIRETGARGALLLTVEDDEITTVETLTVDVLRWERLDIVLGGQDDMETALLAVGKGLEALLEKTPADLPLAVRVIFSGMTPAHKALLSKDEQLRQEVIARAVALTPDRIWIEKVKVSTQPPVAGTDDTDPGTSHVDALADLEKLARGSISDESFVTELIDQWQLLLKILPREVREASQALVDLHQSPETHLQAWLEDSLPLMMDRVEQVRSPGQPNVS